VQRVPVVGRVKLLAAVAVSVIGNAPKVVKAFAKLTLCPAVRDIDSPPARLIELVLRLVVSFTVKVFPAPKVKVPEPVEITLPLKVAEVIALANMPANL
jgi:hypothetical protein